MPVTTIDTTDVLALANIQVRPGTFDQHICWEVLEQNVYRVPNRFGPADVILDIGAHIGCFSLLAYARGSRKIFAFEALPQNYRMLVRHAMGLLDAVHPVFGAVWRETDVEFMCYVP